MRSGFTALRAKGRITSQSFIAMSNDKRENSSLSEKELEIIKRTAEECFEGATVWLYGSHARLEGYFDTRFTELKNMLEVEED
jgi:hypothetical protein